VRPTNEIDEVNGILTPIEQYPSWALGQRGSDMTHHHRIHPASTHRHHMGHHHHFRAVSRQPGDSSFSDTLAGRSVTSSAVISSKSGPTSVGHSSLFGHGHAAQLPSAVEDALNQAMQIEQTPASWRGNLRFIMARESSGIVDNHSSHHSARGLFQRTGCGTSPTKWIRRTD